jgi:hypothetical protein
LVRNDSDGRLLTLARPHAIVAIQKVLVLARSSDPDAVQRLRDDRLGWRSARFPRWLVLSLALATFLLSFPHMAVAAQRFQADDWITECGGRPDDNDADCSLTVPFWQTTYGGNGSFALVVMLQTGNVGIVGSPQPLKAELRVDKGAAATCRGSRYCVFPAVQSLAVVKQLANASLILIDVFTAKTQFRFSLSPKGYQAGIAQIRAWGYQLGAH